MAVKPANKTVVAPKTPNAGEPMLAAFRTVVREELASVVVDGPITVDNSISDSDIEKIAVATEAKVLELVNKVDFGDLSQINLMVQAMQVKWPGLKEAMEEIEKAPNDKTAEATERYSGSELLEAAKELGDSKLVATIEFQNKFVSWRVWEHKQTRGIFIGLAVGGAIMVATNRYLARQVADTDVDADLDIGEGDMPFEVMSA